VLNKRINSRSLKVSANHLLVIALFAASAVSVHPAHLCFAVASDQQNQGVAAPRAVAKRIGAIKAINGTEITLTPDSGLDLKITVQPATQIVRFAPGETNVNNATPIQLQDLQVGDRIRATGWASDDSLPLPVLKIVVIKRSDLETRHQQDLQDWQKRGVGGLAKAVDPAAGIVTISGRGKNVVIHSSSHTVIRRYAPDSARFDDARSGTLQEIHPGDQVTARGDRSADGAELAAQEIVSGSFPIITATVNSVDTGSSILNLHDLSSKKTILIKITQDSQLRRVPTEMAQIFAKRLGGGAGGPVPVATSSSGSDAVPPGGMSAGNGTSARSGGGLDFQRLLDRLPTASLADLHKGDAVIIVTTEGTASGAATAIKLYSGVEPILQASPSAGQAMMLAPWSLGAPAGDLGGP
jgi:hypothetical protein